MDDAIHMGFRAYSNALRDGKPNDECVEAAMRAALSYKHTEPGIHELLQLAVDTGLEPGKVYTTQNLVEAVKKDIEKITKIKDVKFGPKNTENK